MKILLLIDVLISLSEDSDIRLITPDEHVQPNADSVNIGRYHEIVYSPKSE